MAVNCLVSPAGIAGFAGVTEIETSVAVVTVKVVLPDIAPNVAVIVAVPGAIAVAMPAASTVAIDGEFDDHVTVAVISRGVPSEYAPVAVNCSVTPTGIEGVAGVTEID